jgi:redox-sensing transcriptional repressor
VKSRKVPRATVARLPIYLQCLRDLPPGQSTASSDQLARMAAVNPAKVRKDLSYLGSYGVRGVGYDVEHLRSEIERALGLASDWPVAIVGVGNLGSALANYGGFGDRGFQVVGLFDADPKKVGKRVDGLAVEDMDRLEEAVTRRGVAIGIIATPAHAAQEVADRLAAAGVRSILNFAPAVLQVPRHVELRQVDLSTELQILGFYLAQARSRPAGRPPRAG